MVNFGAECDAECPRQREYFPKHQPECERPTRNMLTKVVFLRIIKHGYAAPDIAGPAAEPCVLAHFVTFGVCFGVQFRAARQSGGL